MPLSAVSRVSPVLFVSLLAFIPQPPAASATATAAATEAEGDGSRESSSPFALTREDLR